MEVVEKIDKCPYCGGSMIEGYIQWRDKGYWCSKRRKIAAMVPVSGDSILLNSNDVGVFSGTVVNAMNCYYCKKIIISYKR